MAAIVFPANPAGQTPVNTFSTTSTPFANTSNSFTYTWSGTAWTSAPSGGGGGGTVTTVSGTLPISVATGTSTPVISIAAASTTATGSIQIATLAEAATGTNFLKALTPATGVPKDAATMTGAAIMPSGTTAQEPAAPVVGMQRYNTDTGYEEVYTGVTNGWRKLAYYTPLGTPPDLIISADGPLPNGGYYDNIIINAGVTATASASTSLRAKTSIQINGTVIVGPSFPGGLGGSAASAGIATVGGSIGQGFGAERTYGYSALAGTGGGGAQFSVDAGSGNGSNGGAGGGALILRSEGNITVGAAGVITADGDPASVGAATVGTGGAAIPGAGGGSGGMIYLEAAISITLNAAARLNARGGAGSDGFSGGSIVAYGAGGGGGGGGGYVIVTSPANTTTGANFVVTGGAGGVDSTTPPADPSKLGANGGSWAGLGGLNDAGVHPNIAGPGAAGQTLFNATL